jgi:hypothetical protein
MEPEIVAPVSFTPTNEVIARRISRITFGGALIVGSVWLVRAATTDRFHVSAYEIITITWLAALALAIVSRIAAATIRWTRDPDFLFTHSVCVPMVGLALLLPITLHMLVVRAWWTTYDFNQWVAVSVIVAGLPHLVLAIAVISRGRALVAGRPAVKPGTIYGITIAAACVPFIVLFLPPMVVAVTGLPFLWLLRAMETLVARERAELARAPHVPPRAVVI